jgi:UDP-3-O-[3-hydroxymyristoyl] N-acetylglucosamine deacetylase
VASLASIPARTLAGTARVEGLGLFTPARSALTIRPAVPGYGVMFQRTDLPHHPHLPALAARTIARDRQTVLGDPAAANDPKAPSVQTVEHLLSAVHALGISDLLIELDGPEVPLLDGSSAQFLAAMRGAGIADHPVARAPSPAIVTDPIALSDGPASIVALPLPPLPAGSPPRLEIEYRLEYTGFPSLTGSASFTLNYARPDADAYAREIAPARTFCTDQEALAFRARGLFTHLTPAPAASPAAVPTSASAGPGQAPQSILIMGPTGPASPPGPTPRFADEPARHKVLDVLGDLMLAGRPIHAKIQANRSGHTLNRRLAAILAGI